MKGRNPEDAAALRRVVTQRLQRFFADLTTRLAAGTAEIWRKVERRLGQPSGSEPEGTTPPPGSVRPMQQQPVQQQQTKAEPEDKK
jgi:hypothetical protein